MTNDPNKETVNRFAKALDQRIETAERIIMKKEAELSALIQQRSVLNAIMQDTAEEANDHIPPDVPTDEEIDQIYKDRQRTLKAVADQTISVMKRESPMKTYYFLTDGLSQLTWPKEEYSNERDAEKTMDSLRELKPTPNDEDMSMVRVPWTLLAALDVTLTDAGSDKIMAAKELRKYTDDDADVRESGAQAFYEEHVDG